jgi:anti-sigma factor RsiW
VATSSALTCQQLVELVTDYLENALSQGDQRRFEEHLAACPHCTAYLQQMRTTIAATGRLTEESLPAGARDELLAVFREWSTTR